MGKSTISMAIFNCYVKLREGNGICFDFMGDHYLDGFDPTRLAIAMLDAYLLHGTKHVFLQTSLFCFLTRIRNMNGAQMRTGFPILMALMHTRIKNDKEWLRYLQEVRQYCWLPC